ncbi:carbohydrate kinase family protein [Actinomyces ruminis]|uniref:Carbohydrate kinase PfkB domain-containing protein n=1 Tax=Actinomyces ruminis TaxID=1937003 RepID=A0ABX4MDG4_9ACTO|nr:PfkB family carbohydrate kinase [Actinomyces ruminis]PHP53492.1 hypothetical protein BW737_002370 [Actinomyces ruminis]
MADVVDIVFAGHICIDLTPSLDALPPIEPGRLSSVGALGMSLGGAVGNGTRTLAQLGGRPAAVAAIGDDALGDLCEQLLRAQGVGEVSLARRRDASTSYSLVFQPRGSDRSFWHHTGANEAFDGAVELPVGGALHIGYPAVLPGLVADDGRPLRTLLRRAREQGMLTSLDTVYCPEDFPLDATGWERFFRAVLPETDLFCPSWEDITSTFSITSPPTPDAVTTWAERFLAWGARIVLITTGPDGGLLRVGKVPQDRGRFRTEDWDGTNTAFAAPKVARVVTTNATGDTFKTAFLYRALGGAAPGAAIEFARTATAYRLRGLSLEPLSKEKDA